MPTAPFPVGRDPRSSAPAPTALSRPLLALAGAVAVIAVWAGGPGAATALACDRLYGCADVSISGHAEPQPVRRGEKSTFKITPKNDGPGAAYGIDVHIDIPRQLKIRRVKLYGGHRCRTKGSFVRCRMGDFANQQLGVIKVRVKARKRGTFIGRARVYSSGVEDPNAGNNRVRMTVGVKGKRDG